MLKRILPTLIAIIFMIACYGYTFHVIANIEMYSPRLRNDLEIKVKSGDEDAIGYYTRRYLSKGIELF